MKSILLAAAFLGSLCWAGTNPYNIIPEPVNVTTTSGTTKNLKIVHEQKVAGLGNEGYTMKLTPGGVELRYTTPNGKAMAMATLFGNIMTIEDVPGTVARAILSFSENKIVILMLINVLLLIVGTFMEALAAIVILVPILLPIVTGVGVSPLHFGVIIVVNLAIGFITPPVGVNLFVASGVAKAKLENIAGQALPMIALMLIVLLICTYIPEVPLILVGGPH